MAPFPNPLTKPLPLAALLLTPELATTLVSLGLATLTPEDDPALLPEKELKRFPITLLMLPLTPLGVKLAPPKFPLFPPLPRPLLTKVDPEFGSNPPNSSESSANGGKNEDEIPIAAIPVFCEFCMEFEANWEFTPLEVNELC